MRERVRYEFAIMTAEVMCTLLEDDYRRGARDLDGMMMRLKDLSAYSLTHAEIMDQREGAELLALAMLFGATSDPRYHSNQERLGRLSGDTLDYQGQAGVVEREVAIRQGRKPPRKTAQGAESIQPRLL